MKSNFKPMSFILMLSAVLFSLTVGFNLSKMKAFSADLVGYIFPIDCRVEYRGGDVIESAAVTFSGDKVIITADSLSETADINDVVLTGLDDSQQLQNAMRVFMLFALILLVSFSFAVSLVFMSINCRDAAFACSRSRAGKSESVPRRKAVEAGPATAAA